MEHLGYELTSELSKEAFDRDKAEMLEAFNPRYVTIDQERTPAGCLGLFKADLLVASAAPKPPCLSRATSLPLH